MIELSISAIAVKILVSPVQAVLSPVVSGKWVNFIQKDNLQRQQAELETLDKLAKFSIKLTCAYCQQYNVTPIQLNQKNTFKCESCNQVNGISMQFMATTLTSPIESVKIPIENSGSIEFKVT